MKRAERGFTLIEVIVAVAILAIGIVAVSEVFSISLRSLRSTREGMDLSITALTEMRRILQDRELEEGSGTEAREDYTLEWEVEETDRDRTEGLPYRFLEVTVRVKKGRKVYELSTQRLVKGVFK